MIARFRNKFGDKFDYSKFEYNGMTSKSIFICPIHGEFERTAIGHLYSVHGCQKCSNDATADRFRGNVETFIAKAQEVHGTGEFDYSLVKYRTNRIPVEIICKQGHHFMQKPNCHLNGHGCPECLVEKRRTKIGTAPSHISIKDNHKAYRVWGAMIERCYGLNGGAKYPSYAEVSVCDEWRYSFENFLQWHNQNYIEGWQLDKDLLSEPNNKVYSPETCCYLPTEINRSLYLKTPKFTKYGKKIRVYINLGQEQKHLGCFTTYEEALAVYMRARAERMKSLADKYKTQLTDRVYNALISLYK